MDRDESRRIIEALLFVSDKPVSIDALKDVMGDIEPADVRSIVDELNAEYASTVRSFSIKEIAGGFQMLTDPVYSKWVSALFKRGPDRITGPGLETLAIIAYKQPITRSDIELIRGVNVDGVLRTLEERQLIRTRGRLDAPGRPILYGTTNEFLQHFGLKSLEELPNLKEFKETDLDFVKEQDRVQVVDTQTGKLQSDVPEAPQAPEANGAAESGITVDTAKEGSIDGSKEPA